MFSDHLNGNQGVKFWGHMFNPEKYEWRYHFIIPLAMYECSNFSEYSMTFILVYLSDFSYPCECGVVSQVVLIWISLTTSDVEHLFTFLLAICVSLWRNVYSNPLPIFKIGLSFCCWVLRVLYVFLILNPYYDLQISTIFSYSVGCRFTFLIMSLTHKHF